MATLISIIIPLYNKTESIASTLNSVINQSFKDYEIIIINDGSTDNSLAIAETYIFNNISIYTTTNNGVSYARNYGVSKASSDLIAFLDADDIWLPHHLDELYDLYQSYPGCGLYANNYDKLFFNKTIIRTVYNGLPKDFRGVLDDYFRASTIDSIAWTSGVAVHKSIFKTHKGFNTNLKSFEDTDLWIRIALKHNIAFSSKVTVLKKIDGLTNHLSLIPNNTDGIILTNQYITNEKKNKSLKKYMDLNRFSFATERKIANDKTSFIELKHNIDIKNLNYKQRIILNLPSQILKVLIKLKYILIRKGLYISPFK
jgi:glycosyltransferase involved in cell wall biosynthesis